MLIETIAEAAQPVAAPNTARQHNRWHAVSIVPHGQACEAVQACRGKRFLSSEAPRLPLQGCNADQCQCRYRHHPDRRGGTRRKDDARAAATERTDRNRRVRVGGRRATDLEEPAPGPTRPA